MARILLAAPDDDVARIWAVGGQSLIDVAQAMAPRALEEAEKLQYGLEGFVRVTAGSSAHGTARPDPSGH